jgi:hypothetical protein
MEDLFEKIIHQVSMIDKTNVKLYSDIFLILTKDNTLKNYSKNKSGIRFKLNGISEETCLEILEYIKASKETTNDIFE